MSSEFGGKRPETPSDLPVMSRRNFIKFLSAVPVGVAVGAALVPTFDELVDEVSERTPIQTGNSAVLEGATANCPPKDSDDECLDKFTSTTSFKLQTEVVSPLLEELVFRAFPSFLIDIPDGDIFAASEKQAIGAAKNVYVGNRSLSMTRKEVIIGAISSVIFGLSHNITNKGFSTDRVPLTQTLGGGILWTLQRKLGIGSNVAAHATYNTLLNKWGD
jgi:membrane protease YdiL (CAAX protease family)